MPTVGLIAGLGRLPLEVAAAARKGGQRVVVVALRELAEPEIAEQADRLEWVYLGEIARTFAFFAAEGVADVVLAGKVPKTFLWERRDAVRPDPRAISILAGLADRKDDSLLGAFADAIEQEGFRLRGQAELAPHLFAESGPLGGVAPTPEQRRDIAFGWPIAKALGALDVGQSVLIQDRAVLALEAVEGTDAAIRRGCGLGEKGRGVCVVKVAKPSQDPRFDVPTVGLSTLRTMVSVGADVLAVEAGRTIVLDREQLIGEADSHGVAVLGLDEAQLERWLLEEPVAPAISADGVER